MVKRKHMRRSLLLTSAIVALAFLPVMQAQADFILWDHERLDVNSPHARGTTLDRSRARVQFGGRVQEFRAYDGSIVLLESGGEIDYLSFYDDSTAVISDGCLTRVSAYGRAMVFVAGGTLDSLSACDTSTVSFYAREFQLGPGLTLDGDRLLGTGVLCGAWGYGTRWTVEIKKNDPTATIRLVPELATSSALALGGLGLLCRRRRTGRRREGLRPPGVRRRADLLRVSCFGIRICPHRPSPGYSR